jgi:hypothetical protein
MISIGRNVRERPLHLPRIIEVSAFFTDAPEDVFEGGPEGAKKALISVRAALRSSCDLLQQRFSTSRVKIAEEMLLCEIIIQD